MPGQRKHNAEEPVDVQLTKDDQNALIAEVKSTNASKGRKGTGRKQVAKSPEDHLPDKAQALKAINIDDLPKRIADDIIADRTPTDVETIRQANDRLTTTQRSAVELFANVILKRSAQQVADEVGVALRTVYDWLSIPTFAAALELRKRENFLSIGRIKLYDVYLKELDKAVPSSRMTEQIAKSLGFFSDGNDITISVNVDASSDQRSLTVERIEDF